MYARARASRFDRGNEPGDEDVTEVIGKDHPASLRDAA